MSERPVLLKVLLRERHWQNYATFCTEYDKAAARIDPDLTRSYPSRAQLHRWLTGSLRSLPYPDHCRVLEEMFPGWTAEQLFQRAAPDHLRGNGRSSGPLQPDTAGPPVFAAPSVGLRPFIEQAFAREHVTIDFAGFSGETLHGAIQEPLDMIRIGQIKPATLTIRMLLPDTSRPMVLPCRADDLTDDPDYRARAHRLTTRHAHAILDTVHELTSLSLVQQADAQIRAHPCPPLFKLYILNGEDVFFGFYPITRQSISLASGPREIYDLMGKDAVVFHHSVHSGRPADAPLRGTSPLVVHRHVGQPQLRVPRMTSPTPGASDLDGILARTRHLLLDFDGPICSIFAGLPAASIADRLRKLFGDHALIPDDIASTPDPFEVFAYAATVSADLAAKVETEMTDLELAAVATAAPTPYIHEVVTACQSSGRSVAVVSNNSARAVHSYLARHGLEDRISLVVARTHHDPALLKPSPHLITQAVSALDAEPGECTLVGDSVTDIQGAHLASVHSIGYANEPGKHEHFTAAGAGAIINSLAHLALRLRARVANPELLQLSTASRARLRHAKRRGCSPSTGMEGTRSHRAGIRDWTGTTTRA